jgi:cobalt-zinc-cadmium efflux system protein
MGVPRIRWDICLDRPLLGIAVTEHQHGGSRGTQRRVLWIALIANGIFLVAEVIGGLAFNSLALLADAAHMSSDVFGLAVALGAQTLMERPATARHTYGLQRAEVIGAQINGLSLLVAAGWIGFEAIDRLSEPQSVEGAGLLAVAALGLIVNLVSAVLLYRAQGHSLNMRGAFLHMAMDAVGSVGAIVVGFAIIIWGATWIDPLISIGIACLVLWSAWRLLRETTHVLLEGTPRGITLADVEKALMDEHSVVQVHHLHLWNLASDVPALSAHVVLVGEQSLHEAQERSEHLKEQLAARFGINHATLEMESRPCESEEVD